MYFQMCASIDVAYPLTLSPNPPRLQSGFALCSSYTPTIFWHRAPSSNPSPVFARALPSARASFSIQGVSTLYSGFAYRVLRSLNSGFALNFQLAKLVWPQNIFFDSPVLVRAPFGEFLDLLLIINYTDWLQYGV